MIGIIYYFNNEIKVASLDAGYISILKDIDLNKFLRIYKTSNYIYSEGILICVPFTKIQKLKSKNLEMMYLELICSLIKE